jgi:hypothetical protein
VHSVADLHMDEARELSRQISDLVDAQQLRPRLLRTLAGSKRASYEALLDICMHQNKRQVAMAHFPQKNCLDGASHLGIRHRCISKLKHSWR